MKIIIDIPEKVYNAVIHKEFDAKLVVNEMRKSIANGTPLPKGHGELVYREDVCNELRYMDNNGFITRSVNHVIEDIKKGVPTIIEADKAESEDKKMRIEEAIDIIKSECYVFNPLNFDRSTMVNTALDMAVKALEQEPCEDAISRQAVLEQTYLWSKGEFLRVAKPFDYLRKRINSLPSVTPKPKTDILDKIRAEIKDNRDEWIKGQDPEWHTYDRCLQIIDKYKAESEEKE